MAALRRTRLATILTVTLSPTLDISTAADEIVHTRKIRCDAAEVQAGGGGVNVARVARRLGADVSAIVTAGGANGERLLTLLVQEGLAPVSVPVEGETRESFTVTERRSGQQYRFVLPGQALSAREIEGVLGALADTSPAPRFVVLSGSLPSGPLADLPARIADAATAAGAGFIVDGPADVLAATRGADLVKPNALELGDLVGTSLATREEIVRAARSVIERGISAAVLVSLGEDGAVLVTADEAFAYRVPQVQLVSAVGAGDSMVGALTAALAQGATLVDAAAMGAAAGAAAILTPGTQLCHREDVLRLLGQITVNRI